MEKEKTILLGGLILMLALSFCVPVGAAPNSVDVNSNLDFNDNYKIKKLKDPSEDGDAATWGYVINAVGGISALPEVGLWRKNDSSDVYLNQHSLLHLSGKVGIGTDSPSKEFDVAGTISGEEYCINGVDCITSWPSAGAGNWAQSGNDIYYNQGNVGIGTSEPAAKLHIYDIGDYATIKLQSSSDEEKAWSIYNYYDGEEGVNNLNFYSYDPDAMYQNVITFTDAGLIGIGTTAPRQHLSIGSYLDIYDGPADSSLEYPSIRSSRENLIINGSKGYGGVYFNYDIGSGVKFFAHSGGQTNEMATLNDAGDLYLNGTLKAGGISFEKGKNSYIRGKLGVGKISNPNAVLDIIAEAEPSTEKPFFNVSHLGSGDFVEETLRPSTDETTQFSYPSSSPHYPEVYEVSSDGDDTYIETNSGTGVIAITDLFGHGDLTGPVDSIDYVKVVAVCRSVPGDGSGSSTPPAFASPAIRLQGEEEIYANETFTELDENYQIITFIATQNPYDNNAWEESDIASLQIGVQAREGSLPSSDPQQNPASFIPGTQVLMADGSYRNIEKIKAGDKIVSYDLDNQSFINKEVVATTNGYKDYLLINNKLGITLNQKIYIVNKGFIEAREAKIGDYLLNKCKDLVRIDSIINYHEKVNVYDLILESPHNFFADGYLVHNTGGVSTSAVRCTQIYATVGYFKSAPISDLIVDYAGNIGIGTAGPSYELDILSDNNNIFRIKGKEEDRSIISVSQNADGKGIVKIGNVGDDPVLGPVLTVNAQEEIPFCNVNSKLGIGQAYPPNYALDVNGDARFSDGQGVVTIGEGTVIVSQAPIDDNYVATKEYVDSIPPVWDTSIQIGGYSIDPCDSANAGKIHYYEDGNSSHFEICMRQSGGSGQSSYGWHSIASYSWTAGGEE
ncbi:hypothetical protein B6D52_03155 [Candidatus Parcubacteria bacterium 4484_255]|nr:MAG: hypothetical protein B6D52_03155 [Candidatus Parcubacteria bacterium 4484_255]